MYKIEYQDIDLVEYKKVWDYQEELNQHMQQLRLQESDANFIGYLLFCEHPHVYTLGKSGNSQNLLITDEMLKQINATFYQTNRGGDITYHGPGQIVGYPILDLQKINMGIKTFVFNIEETIIRTLNDYQIKGERINGATGVWLDTNIPEKTRKICAIGIRISHWVSMHGFAFNINSDLNYFQYIHPCGFSNKGVTSLQKELGSSIDMDEVKQNLLEHFYELFNIES